MTVNVSADVERLLNERIASGMYPDHDAVLRAAIAALEQRESILARIDRGTEELRRGEGLSLTTDAEWDAFFANVAATD